jgi:hypothetical protein
MPVTVKVNGEDNTLVHKGSMGMATCTAPDVCKTPSPGGPVPTPYPKIISLSSDLENGTTTVTADGGNSCAIKGSDFSRCTGDEPGTAGGVKSNVNMKEATWILYSFDVKMDGGNACRKSDKMMMNHENTVCMSGEDQMAETVKALQDLACKCDEDIQPEPGETCRQLGVRKHACCDEALKKGKVPGAKGEQGYKRDGSRTWSRTQRRNESFGQWRGRIRGKLFPDAAVLDASGKVGQFADFKFQCPKPPRQGDPRPQTWYDEQFQKYRALARKLNPKAKDPVIVSNEACK